ncbi:phosphoribosylaminoimidazolesuccinocarboxamide synthase [Pneumocystis murina B123]|uniref:Phosphoribosylaminoimidazole-succinocarboxamide synthase n=1 Tax=Pneumocystis murina (strain B123) TaxID=1069680 RepID=M7NQH4_PNEMU|nr:phosphoribosylaminoimidazolesuccinocarboxamide synthase [Pneumocystis murina B123]EMR09341.1 phosphoribosylaminoimidazolesuccinocarboxamide synthase [Pneumocystis murina B123]
MMVLEKYQKIIQGKVRDIYELDVDRLLFITSDRISAYDVVLKSEIPEKGKILTALSLFWFKKLGHICKNHLIDVNLPIELEKVRKNIEGRFMIVRKYQVLPIEAIVRGYLTGSAWKEYVKQGTVHGIPLRSGFKKGQALDMPLFTPSKKAKPGEQDENINPKEASNEIGEKYAEEMERLSLLLYKEAHIYAMERGIIIADTKFEFGVDTNGHLVLVDEVLTPDSSRFWICNSVDGEPYSLDKQYIRNWLEAENKAGQKDVILPESVIYQTRQRYIEVYEKLTGNTWTK